MGSPPRVSWSAPDGGGSLPTEAGRCRRRRSARTGTLAFAEAPRNGAQTAPGGPRTLAPAEAPRNGSVVDSFESKVPWRVHPSSFLPPPQKTQIMHSKSQSSAPPHPPMTHPAITIIPQQIGKRDFCASFHFSSVVQFSLTVLVKLKKRPFCTKKPVPNKRRIYSGIAKTAATISYSRNCRGLKNPQKTVPKHRRIYSRMAKTGPRNRGRIFGNPDFCASFHFSSVVQFSLTVFVKLKKRPFCTKKPSRTSAEYIRE